MYSSFLEEGIVFDQSVSGKAIVNSDCEGQICCPSLNRESSQKREDSLPKIRYVMKRIAIYALVVGLIFPFTQVARGQQAGPVQPPPSGAVAQNSSGGPSASDVANDNNPIAPMNALFFQNYYAPTGKETTTQKATAKSRPSMRIASIPACCST